jgi:hypothetical protein
VLHPSSGIWLAGSVRFSTFWLSVIPCPLIPDAKIGSEKSDTLQKMVAGQPEPDPQKQKKKKKKKT